MIYLAAFHDSSSDSLLEKLKPLNFGAEIYDSKELTELEASLVVAERMKSEGRQDEERRILWTLLLINGAMFVAELILGLVSESTGLISDAMDMFADAAIYSVSLYAVGKSLSRQRKTARLSGFLQLALALLALAEVLRRFALGSEPEADWMMVVSTIALIANSYCLLLINKHRSGGLHMRASAIFSANDVIANAGVILAGILVAWSGSRYPDLIIGGIIAAVVLRGAFAILRISKEPA